MKQKRKRKSEESNYQTDYIMQVSRVNPLAAKEIARHELKKIKEKKDE